MRKALLAVAGAALMGTILVAPGYSEVGHTFSVSVDPDRAIADFSEAIRLDPKDAPRLSANAATRSPSSAKRNRHLPIATSLCGCSRTMRILSTVAALLT